MSDTFEDPGVNRDLSALRRELAEFTDELNAAAANAEARERRGAQAEATSRQRAAREAQALPTGRGGTRGAGVPETPQTIDAIARGDDRAARAARERAAAEDTLAKARRQRGTAFVGGRDGVQDVRFTGENLPVVAQRSQLGLSSELVAQARQYELLQQRISPLLRTQLSTMEQMTAVERANVALQRAAAVGPRAADDDYLAQLGREQQALRERNQLIQTAGGGGRGSRAPGASTDLVTTSPLGLSESLRRQAEQYARLQANIANIEALPRAQGAPGLSEYQQAINAGPVASGAAQQAQAIDQMAAARARDAAAARVSAADMRSAASVYGELDGQLERNIRTLGLSGDQFRRHGALTTEFIEAARKGQVTLSELGYQVTATIGKFAGWTAAASAVYGAAAAMQAVGKGALDSLDGVNTIQRVVNNIDTQSAQKSLRDLSREFNLPIDQVATAAYGMGKVFQDQTRTFEATRSALFAVKVGELDAATATQYLTSIIRGTGKSADDLGPIFDKINNLQNKFGGNVGQLTAGVAKAAGAFTNAGGGIEYLLSLLQAGAATTSYTATEIGTALARVGEILQRPARRTSVAEMLGLSIEDAGNVEKVFEAAFQKIREGASKQEVATIASTIATPQLATRIIPILNREGLFRQIQGQATDAASAGSSQRELDRALQAPRERIAALGNDLQRLGSSLATSGVLEPLVAMVTVLDKGLNLANGLLDIFGDLPKPLQQGLVYLTQIYGVMALLRRFDVGGATGIGVLRRNPQATERAQVLSGLGEETKYLQEERRRAAMTGARRTFDADQENARIQTLYNGRGFEDLDENEQKEVERRELRRQRFSLEALDAIEDEKNIRERIETVEKQSTEITKRTGFLKREQLRNVTDEVGVQFSPGTLDRPSPTAPLDISEGALPNAGSTFVPITGAAGRSGTALQQAEREAAAAGRQMDRFERNVVRAAAPFTAIGTRARALGNGLRAFAGNIIESFGAFDVLLIGAFALYEGIQHGLETSKQADERFAQLASQPGRSTPQQLRASAQAELNQRSLADRLRSSGGLISGLFGVEDPDTSQDRIARQNIQTADTIDRVRAKGVALTGPEIYDRYNDALKAAGDDVAAINKARDEALRENENSQLAIYGPNTPKTKAIIAKRADEIREKARELSTINGSLDTALATASTEQLSSDSTLIGARVNAAGGIVSGNVAKQIGQKLAQLYAKLGSDSAEDYVKDVQTIQSLTSTGLDALKAEVESTSKYATPAESRVAARSALARARTTLLGGTQDRIKALQDRRASSDEEISRLQSQLDVDPSYALRGTQTGAATGPLGLPNVGPLAGTTVQPDAAAQKKLDRITALREQNKRDRAAEEQLRKQLGLSRKEFEALVKELDREDLDKTLQFYDATTSKLQSQTADPVAQARILATRLHSRTERIRAAVQKGIAGQDELASAVAAENQAMQQLASSQLSRLQSQQGLEQANYNLANPTDERGQLTETLALAQQYQSAVRAKGTAVDPAEFTNAQRAVSEARLALVNYNREQAKALLDAQEADALSRTDDPVQQAKISADYAKRKIADATTPAERLQAQADARTKARTYKQAQQQDQYDTLRLSFDLDKIDQQSYLERLEALRKRLSGNKQLRDSIDREIASLKKDIAGNQGDLSLNLDNLKLPTVYEIRRAIRGATGPRGTNVSQNNSNVFNVTITDRSGAEEFGRQLEAGVGIARVNLRAAGVLG